ncbi:hypothetical protein TrispH2_004728 [Trichoplax sp. H2]|nr:hypothetical protein TrispH2_004728 [Trichoplax sp. H2]|eukprot:RDD43806.1 hypothetical protein TrispH2_004728 [Trichoplax sp. H2]
MKYQRVSEWFCWFLGIILLSSQLGLICVFFRMYVNPYWLLWWGIPGSIILIYWFIVTCRPVKFADRNNNSCTGKKCICYILSPSYVIWLIYSLNLVAQVLALFIKVTDLLDAKSFFGPRVLKLVLSITPFLFTVFVYTYHDRNESQSNNYYINCAVYEVGLDLFDGVEMLENLFIHSKEFNISSTMKWLILIFSSINFILPTFVLYDLRREIRGSHHYVKLKTAYQIFSWIINVFYLVMRVILWRNYNKDISVLFMKNIMLLTFSSNELLRCCCERSRDASPYVV